nr:unnamed protein product [Digitaria exilis]
MLLQEEGDAEEKKLRRSPRDRGSSRSPGNGPRKAAGIREAVGSLGVVPPARELKERNVAGKRHAPAWDLSHGGEGSSRRTL